MLSKFDPKKSEKLRNHPKRGIGFEEAQRLFESPHYEDVRQDYPEQHRAIGWVDGHLYSVVFEIGEDQDGDYYHLVTLWKSTKQEEELYEAYS